MIDDRRVWSWLFIAAAVAGLLYLLAPVLTPFALSALFAYLGSPLITRLEARGFSRGNTPVDRLHLVGAATWPGAGVGAGSGFLLARQLGGR